VSTAALADAAAARGLLYAPTRAAAPCRRSVATLPPARAGLRGLKHGVTRNYVLSTTAVLPTGEVIRTGGRLWKDVAGYDLTRLLTGSEGTQGVLTEITVALLPMPATTNTGVAYFPTLAEPSAR
jgi:glycolate oxidase